MVLLIRTLHVLYVYRAAVSLKTLCYNGMTDRTRHIESIVFTGVSLGIVRHA